MAGPDLKAFTKLKWYIQVAIVAGVCGALLAATWYWFLTPMQTQITEKEAELDKLQKEVAASLLLKKKFEQFKADTIELGKKLDALKVILPLEKETDQILKTIQSEAVASGVKVLRYNLSATIDHEVYMEWPWEMEVVGTYNNVSTFFDRLRRLPRLLNVSNLKVSSRATEGELAFTSSIGSTYRATTFIYHEEPIASAAPPPKPAK